MTAPSPHRSAGPPPLLVGGAALVAFVLLAVWTLSVAPDRIESAVERSARDALVEAGVRGVRVQVDGRKVRAIGAVASAAEQERAVAALEAAPGVSQVDSKGILVQLGLEAPSPGAPPPAVAPPSAVDAPPEPDPNLERPATEDPAPADDTTAPAPAAAKHSSQPVAAPARRRARPAPASAPPTCSQRAAAYDNTVLPYARGSANLRGSSVDTLDEVRRLLELCPSLFVQLRGHADELRTPLANHDLGERRARSAGEWLHREGIPDHRMLVTWAGVREPAPLRRRGVGLRLYDGGTP